MAVGTIGAGSVVALPPEPAQAAVEPASADLTCLPRGTRVIYRVSQRFRCSYDAEATDLEHRLVVMAPRRHGDQAVRTTDLVVSATTARTTWQRGHDGTRIATVRLAEVPAELDVTVTVTVVVDRVAGGPRPRQRATALTGRRLLDPTPLTLPDDALTAAARSMVSADPQLTARRFCSWVHRRIRYVQGSTDVPTTAAQALAGGQGVCQDQAHVMLALCRAVGLPARYVSGHLVGDGSPHAWVEVIMSAGMAARVGAGVDAEDWEPGAIAVAYDPSHDRLADLRYITLAVGRDYSDVAPTSGWYVGAVRGVLAASRRVSVLGVEAPA